VLICLRRNGNHVYKADGIYGYCTINVYRKEIKNVYYVGGVYRRWSLICLLKGGNGWLLQKHGEWYSMGELNSCR
jgi:hypothetical protein